MPEENIYDDEITVLYLRIPTQDKERIKKSANAYRRTLNQQALVLIRMGLVCLEKSLISEQEIQSLLAND